MSPDRDSGRREGEEPEIEGYEVNAGRSIFSALWFRALLVVLVLGVIAAVGVPYLLDVTTQPVRTPTAKWTAAAPTPAVLTASPAVVPPPAPVPVPTTPPAVTAPKSPATTPPRSADPVPAQPKPTVVAKVVEPPRQAAKETPKDTTKRTAASTAGKPAAKPVSPASAGGSYWVQVGAFKDSDTAKRLAARLGEQGFRAEQSTTTKGGGAPSASVPSVPPAPASDRYNVLVSGASAAEVDAKLAGKGKTSESTEGGVVVQPSLSLREAIALARDLADAGFNVQVRRTAGPVPRAAAAGRGETLHRVRVGGFADHAAAVAAMKALQGKGFTPFIARGNP